MVELKGGKCYGTWATLKIWNPEVGNGERSFSQIWNPEVVQISFFGEKFIS